MKKFKLKRIELFESLDFMPLFNWEQLNITGNHKWMYVREKDHSRKLPDDIIEKKYFELHDQYSEISGDTATMDKLITLYSQRMDARVLMDKDKSQVNWVNHYSDMIKQLMAGGDEVDIIKNRMLIQKLYGMPIDAKKTTVTEFIKITEVVKETASSNTEDNG